MVYPDWITHLGYLGYQDGRWGFVVVDGECVEFSVSLYYFTHLVQYPLCSEWRRHTSPPESSCCKISIAPDAGSGFGTILKGICRPVTQPLHCVTPRVNSCNDPSDFTYSVHTGCPHQEPPGPMELACHEEGFTV